MRFLEKTGKTIQDAVNSALLELGISEQEALVEVLEEPSKGFLGILGNKLAKVKVTEKYNPVKEAKYFLVKVCREFGVKPEFELQENKEHTVINIRGEDLGILIGRRGDTLDSLQYLTNLAVNKDSSEISDRVKIILDVEGYRGRREETLIKLAQRLSEKVKRTRSRVVLEPMNPHERRVIHTALQNDNAIQTYSEGEEPYRKVVITLKK